jgi:hypothetical protein
MVFPLIPTRMEKGYHLTSHSVDPRQIWTLVAIAAVAGERQIADVVQSAMLARNYVFNVVEQMTVGLMKPTVFAAIVSPLADESTGSRVHSLLRDLSQLSPRLNFEDGNKVRSVYQRVIFGLFVGRKRAFIGVFGEHVDPLLHRGSDAKVDEALRGLRIQTAAQGVEKAIQPGRGGHAFTLARSQA